MKNNYYLMIAGILSIVAGIFAFFNPLAATLTVVELTSWLFLFVGILQLIAAWRMRGSSLKWWLGISGVVVLLMGYSLFSNPFEGAITLTLLLGILFLFGGLIRLFLAPRLKRTPWFLPMVLSAIVSLGLAAIIFFDLAKASGAFLGVMLAIELIALGISLLSLALKRG